MVACTLSAQTITTLIGNGKPGFSANSVNNPYGLMIGPDGALYFCDIDNHAIRRLDLKTTNVTTVVGTGEKGNSGDGGPATRAQVDQPYELRFDKAGNLFFVDMPNHVVRRVDKKTGIITTIAGTGQAGFSGDGGPASKAQFKQPHSIALDRSGGLLVCDIGNHRVRRIDLATGMIDTFLGTGERGITPDGPAKGVPINGPRALDFDRAGNLYLVLREGNSVYKIDPEMRISRIAGRARRVSQATAVLPCPRRSMGRRVSRFQRIGVLYLADTENHAIRRVDTKTGDHHYGCRYGERGDGPDGDPRKCRMNRPHGIFVDSKGTVYIGDSESHRIRVLREK